MRKKFYKIRRHLIKKKWPIAPDLAIFSDNQRRKRLAISRVARMESDIGKTLGRWSSNEDDADLRDILGSAADLRNLVGESWSKFSNTLRRVQTLPMDTTVSDSNYISTQLRNNIRDTLQAEFDALHILGLRLAAIGASGHSVMECLPTIPLSEYTGYEQTRQLVYQTVYQLKDIQNWVENSFPRLES